MKNKEVTNYIIRHKDTGQLWRAPSGKTSWRSKGAAKNAWSQMDIYDAEEWCISTTFRIYHWGTEKIIPRFDDQDVYVLSALEEQLDDSRLKQAERLLQACLGRVDYPLNEEIREFLENE